ncbi:hypothetical protein BDN70DRAFT_688985 [Pholiota conissans]|uniref:Uncharacterized protein n=1 Tax=Pholiota conissans TaxID=109636 RepID=A0A9P6D0N5_9AGAR|nr:hypothetical protein BDN70DRAFT_688985 [Pholiota conissans]
MTSAFGEPRQSLGLDPSLWSDITLAEYVGAYMFKAFLYGLYTNLIFFGVYLLCINRRTLRWTFIVIGLCMFTISSADITLSLVFLFKFALKGQKVPILHPNPSELLFITNNLIAQSVIIYRSYMVWRRRRLIVIAFGAFLFSLSVIGYAFAISTSSRTRGLTIVNLWMAFGLSVCLTPLTAGRIYWSARRASSVLGPDSPRRYYSIFAIIIDSGAIYPLYLLLDLVVKTIVLDAGLNQIVGILPTLIISQRALGACIHNLGTPTQTRDEEAARSNPSTPVLDSIYSLAATAIPSGGTPPNNRSGEISVSSLQGHDNETV